MAAAKGKKTAEKKRAEYDFSDLSIEDGLSELDGISESMEDPELPLEEAFSLYEKGTALLSYVNQKVGKVEKQVMLLKENGEEEPFDEE